MRKKQIQILMVSFLFLSMVLLIQPSFLSVIQPDKPIGNTLLTVGDALTFFALFGTSVTIGLWLLLLQKKRKTIGE